MNRGGSFCHLQLRSHLQESTLRGDFFSTHKRVTKNPRFQLHAFDPNIFFIPSAVTQQVSKYFSLSNLVTVYLFGLSCDHIKKQEISTNKVKNYQKDNVIFVERSSVTGTQLTLVSNFSTFSDILELCPSLTVLFAVHTHVLTFYFTFLVC